MNSIISIIPIVLLFVLMLGFKVTSWKSALITLLATVLMTIFWVPSLGILPERFAADSTAALAGCSVIEGTLKAIFPILIIILMAIYSYNILVESKEIEVIKAQFMSFTDDKGVLVLMMVWGFGGLLEGMAGFGFKPMFSALVALLGNTVATGFGAVGVPVTTLANEITPGGVASPETLCEVSSFSVIQLSPLFVIIPFVILTLTDRKAVMKNLGIALWVGLVSVGVQYCCARWLGAETPAILGSVAAILAIIIYAKVFVKSEKSKKTPSRKYTMGETFRAWSVYIFILVFILVSGALCPPVNSFLKSHLVSSFEIPVIGSTFKFGWLSNAGLMLFLGSVAGGLCQGLGWRKLLTVLARTTVNLRYTAITIISLISIASVMNYSGMIASIATGLVAVSGSFYPFFAPLIGAIGTFVTGSDTSSNILFGKLPQSIAIATASCDMKGKDDAILRKALPYALGYIIIGGLIVYFGGL